jgi:DNA-binding SARP family transcriptional activator
MMTPSRADNRLIIKLLGTCDIRCAGETVHLETAKTMALLAYLILQPGPHERHKLAGLLWGNLPEERAYRDLRHALWDLRRMICAPGLTPVLDINLHSIAYNPMADAWVDVMAFEHAIKQSIPSEAVAYYTGDLLDGFYVHDAPEFEEWLLIRRENLHITNMFALRDLVELAMQQHDYHTGLVYARRVLQSDPWREEAHRDMMHLLALSGDRSAALEQFSMLQRLLWCELGVEPTQETLRLYLTILDGDAALLPLRSVASMAGISNPKERAPGSPTLLPMMDGDKRYATQWHHNLDDPDCTPINGRQLVSSSRRQQDITTAYLFASRFEHGVFFVKPDRNSLPEGLPCAIASALRFQPIGSDPLLAQLTRYLCNKRLLLVLDNFQLALDAKEQLSYLLENAPGVAVMIASRNQPAWLGVESPPRVRNAGKLI